MFFKDELFMNIPANDGRELPAQNVCALCGQLLSEKETAYCVSHAERLDGRYFCQEHLRRFSACPAVRGYGSF